jgi:hypothetical protein
MTTEFNNIPTNVEPKFTTHSSMALNLKKGVDVHVKKGVEFDVVFIL